MKLDEKRAENIPVVDVIASGIEECDMRPLSELEKICEAFFNADKNPALCVRRCALYNPVKCVGLGKICNKRKHKCTRFGG